MAEEKSIVVDAPMREVYNQWTRSEEWPGEPHGGTFGRRRNVEVELKTCARCGLAMGEGSEPQQKDGRHYCCSGCAQRSDCVCD